MAEKGTPGDGPSLEMPPLPFGRKRQRAEGDVATEPQPVAEPVIVATAEPVAGRDRVRRGPRLPELPGLTGVAAPVVTGAAIGALGALLVWLASLGCEAARGTASCGDGPGFLVLVTILVALTLLGSALLRAFGVPDAGSTSLLAVGVTAVLVLVFFTDSLFEWWMALAVPVVSAVAYALAWWVTTRAVQEPDEDRAPDRR